MEESMKRRTLSFRTRILIIISLFLLSANAVLGTIMLHQSKSAMKTLIQQRMLDISNSAADLLDGDALAVIEAEDRDTITMLRRRINNIASGRGFRMV
jgi:sensor histidine kinase regulating citrate/malate metabolism